MDPATIAVLIGIAKVTAPLIADGTVTALDLIKRWRSKSVITEEQAIALMLAARKDMQAALEALDAELDSQPEN